MPAYYLFIVLIVLLTILFIRFFIIRKKNIPVELFAKALRNENSGHFEEALVTYETALNEVKKVRFHSTSLKNKISEKLKVLHTVIAYKNNIRPDRQPGLMLTDIHDGREQIE